MIVITKVYRLVPYLNIILYYMEVTEILLSLQGQFLSQMKI